MTAAEQIPTCACHTCVAPLILIFRLRQIPRSDPSCARVAATGTLPQGDPRPLCRRGSQGARSRSCYRGVRDGLSGHDLKSPWLDLPFPCPPLPPIPMKRGQSIMTCRWLVGLHERRGWRQCLSPSTICESASKRAETPAHERPNHVPKLSSILLNANDEIFRIRYIICYLAREKGFCAWTIDAFLDRACFHPCSHNRCCIRWERTSSMAGEDGQNCLQAMFSKVSRGDCCRGKSKIMARCQGVAD
nr:hypothetical protein CFP56_65237 [Quercus suber]